MSGNTVCEIPRGTRVLVTGATGFSGSVLTRALVAAGLDLSVIAREGADRSKFGDSPIRWVTGDVADERAIAAAVETGHPLLVKAALDAVRQWRYRPTRLGGEPVEVETTITVIFELDR